MAKRSFMMLVLFLVAGIPMFAQNATTSVRGTVTDQTGATVVGAAVTLTDLSSHNQRTQAAGKNGEYIFEQVLPAKYAIEVTAEGFGVQKKEVELLVNQPSTVNFSLKVGAAAETVEVTAAATLNFSDATIGNAIANTQIQATPIDSRNVADLLSLQPGVLYIKPNNNNGPITQDSRVGAVAGARSDQGNVTLDGIDDNDQTFGYAFTGVLRSTLDSTEEYRVTTSSANAEAGRSSGAQVTLITKGGTDHFHGSAYEYLRNEYFDANDWFLKKAQLQSGTRNRPGKLERNTFGGTIGGPVLRDKLFFFFNYEGQRTNENQTVTQETPTTSFLAGNIQYKNTSGGVSTITPAQLAALDAGCVGNGVCPNGPGVNANALKYLSQLPAANGLTIGDGLNEGSYTFSSPNPFTLNTSILKLDWNATAAHHIFVRGNLQKDVNSGAQQFPGLPASTTAEDNTKGIAAGDTWTVGAHLVNDIRYGYTRQGYSNRGVGTGSYVDFRFFATPTAETRSTLRSVPLNTITDTLNYTKGTHSIQVGGTWRLIHNNHSSDANSWNSGSTNPYGLSGAPPSPTTIGLPGVANGFANPYVTAYASLVGTTPVVTHRINYQVDPGGATGSLKAQGDYVTRNFVSNEFEYYLQDSWRATPKLTLTYGLRHTLLQVPYEKNGQSAAPTIDTHAFFLQREAASQVGQVYEPNLSFAPNGPAFGRPGYWSKQKTNVAPRFALAYAVDSKTSLRAGAGLYFDHFGQGIVNAFDASGSFGLATTLSSPLGVLSTESAPRFIDRTTLPNLPIASGSSKVSFPYTVPSNSFLITWGVDNKLKTPYSEVVNLSLQRQLPGGFTFEADYVGRFGRHLLQQVDLTTPTNFVDPKSGTSYFQAGKQLSQIVDQNGGARSQAAVSSVPSIPFFENLFPQLANIVIRNSKGVVTYDGSGKSATQNIYALEWTTYRTVLGESTALADLDYYCSYGCPQGPRFWQNQFASLYAWSSMGSSSYNAGQFILRHPLTHGLQMDVSYTLGNSIDQGSDAERSNETQTGSGSYITNAWNPEQSRGVSDFDTRHLITANGSYMLPFGKGAMFATNAGRFTDLFLGGWRVAGIARWTSGLPFSLSEPGYTTDWEIGSYAVLTSKMKSAKTVINGTPNAFANPSALNNSVASGGPVLRLPYPGESGQRNNFRGDGYFGADASLTKPFRITEGQTLRFTWEVFNLSNSVRFDPRSLSRTLTSGTLGNYSYTSTTPRRMQFSLRYSF